MAVIGWDGELIYNVYLVANLTISCFIPGNLFLFSIRTIVRIQKQFQMNNNIRFNFIMYCLMFCVFLCEVAAVWKTFISNGTDYGKLKNPKSSKSR